MNKTIAKFCGDVVIALILGDCDATVSVVEPLVYIKASKGDLTVTKATSFTLIEDSDCDYAAWFAAELIAEISE